MRKWDEFIFRQAIRVAEILHKMLGSSSEIAVHDFSDLERSLIHVSGTLTNRQIGSPATDLVLKEVKKPNDEIRDIPNYLTRTKDGKVMKSSTVFLKNQKGDVIGALCINIDISLLTHVSMVLQDFIRTEEHESPVENFYTTVHDVIDEMINQVIKEYNKPATALEMHEKIEVVRKLEERGAFLIKGALDYLATMLGVSKYTLYNYLQKIRAQHEYAVKGGKQLHDSNGFNS